MGSGDRMQNWCIWPGITAIWSTTHLVKLIQVILFWTQYLVLIHTVLNNFQTSKITFSTSINSYLSTLLKRNVLLWSIHIYPKYKHIGQYRAFAKYIIYASGASIIDEFKLFKTTVPSLYVPLLILRDVDS